MKLENGATLAHFTITGKIGEGGMGEVYLAQDTRLGREVAIKVLPDGFTADPDRLARFEREARLLAALSHPGIAQIHEVGAEEGRRFLVMELVPGETLAARLGRGALPLAEALPIALQVAAALEYAHERGIVHRDLKPANVMVNAEGRAKVLDFGLARALEPEATAASASQLAQSPTLTQHGTIAGLLLGTAAYMSPEQAAGKPADRRADIWAFGVMVLEMLTGRQTFQGETVSHLLAGVLKDEPDWSALGDAVPPRIRRLLRQCLRKDARRRLQSIGDARVVLEEVIDGTPELDEASAPVAGPHKPWRPRLGWVVAGLALVAAGLLLARDLTARRSQAQERPLRFELALPQGTELVRSHQFDLLAISRDGRRQVFMVRDEAGDRRLALRDLERLEARVLAGTEDASTPAFSPDGAWVAFFAQRQLLKVPVGGGSPEIVAPTGGYLYAAPDTQMALQRVRETGGAFEPATELDAGRRERTHRWPHAIPGTDVVLFTVDTDASTEFYDDARIEALHAATGERRVVVEQTSRARFVAGHLLFARGGSLYAAPFDTRSLALTGPPAVVVQGVATTVASGAVHFDVSERGDLVFLSGPPTQAATLPVWIRRDGTKEPSGLAADNFDQLSLAPDGRRVALTLNQGGAQDLWIADLERGAKSRLTFSGSVREPVWSPDGRWLAYREQGGIFRQRTDGSGPPELLFTGQNATLPTAFTPDGAHLVIWRETAPGGSDHALLDLARQGQEPRSLVAGPSVEWTSDVSSDGRWLAYVTTETRRPEVYVGSMAGAGGKWQISPRGGFEPRWSQDGSELFFRDGVGDLHSVTLVPGDVFAAGPPQRLADGMRTGDNNRSYSVAPDGQSFLTLGLAVDESVDRLNLVLRWDRELARILRRGE
jgi:serine/threonine protein kinase/Tol biopolymer transport system component